MITHAIVQPSSLIPLGMNIVPLGNVFLFHLTDDLQDRLENLLERKKANALTNEQIAELEGMKKPHGVLSSPKICPRTRPKSL